MNIEYRHAKNPQEELEAEITLNYGRYMSEDQTREKGKLVDPLSQLFEKRMNDALLELNSILIWTGSAAIELSQKAA